MADFTQAIKWMKEGKKVRRESWLPKYFWKVDKALIVESHEGVIDSRDIYTIGESDWEIYEEDADLSSKAKDILRSRVGEEWSGFYYQEADLQKFMRKQRTFEWKSEMIDGRIYVSHDQVTKFFDEFKKDAGNRLID